jgi:peptidoglycan/LPS O-acetylase OafA/YrhL
LISSSSSLDSSSRMSISHPLACPNRITVQIFLWHRIIRLYPVHLTVLAGLVAIVSLAGAAGIALNDPQHWQWKDLFWHLTLLHSWGATEGLAWNDPSWSISAEWFAYLLFPLLAPMTIRVHGRVTALLIAAAALATTAALFAIADWAVLTSGQGAPAMMRVFGEFLCGAALCRAVALGGVSSRSSGDILGAGAFIAFLPRRVGRTRGLCPDRFSGPHRFWGVGRPYHPMTQGKIERYPAR